MPSWRKLNSKSYKKGLSKCEDSEVNNFVKYGRIEHQELVQYRGEQGLQCAPRVFSSGRKSPIYGWSRTQPKVEKSIKNRREIVKIEMFSFGGKRKKGRFCSSWSYAGRHSSVNFGSFSVLRAVLEGVGHELSSALLG